MDSELASHSEAWVRISVQDFNDYFQVAEIIDRSARLRVIVDSF